MEANKMVRNQEWNKRWKEQIKTLTGLGWIPNNDDQKRVLEIINELNHIVDRNTEQESQDAQELNEAYGVTE